jgi:trimethylamine--corrinoid protein Co-methyltransferase
MLTDAQLEEIHYASLEIMRHTGMRVLEAECLELLQNSGCTVTDETLVRFPAGIVEDAIRSAPSRIVLCSREGGPKLHLEGQRSYFGTGSDLPNTIDLETGERRTSLLSDVEKSARLVDSLPNLDFVMSAALPSDVPPETSDRHSFLAMVKNTTKPIVFTAWDERGLLDIIEMAQTIAGSPENLASRPFLLAYLEPTSALQHTEDALRKLLAMVDHGLPFVYSAGAVEGASVPVTSAGSLALGNAECLTGLVISQLRRRGTPFLFGSGNGPLDMRTMVATYGSPEYMLHCLGIAELAHHLYKLPVWGFAGCSDSKIPDVQAGIESGIWILWSALMGANLVHDVGYLESGLTGSHEMIVLGDEVIGLVRRLLRGIPLSPATFALDVIDQLGPGGDYITTPHTTEHYRSVWYPRILDRRPYESWAGAGKPTAASRARDEARERLAQHQPEPLTEATLEELGAMIAEAEARATRG